MSLHFRPSCGALKSVSTELSDKAVRLRSTELGAALEFLPFVVPGPQQILLSGHFRCGPPQVQVGRYMCRHDAKHSANII